MTTTWSGQGPTLFGQDGHADARVAELDERWVTSPPVLLPDQENIFGTNIPVGQVFLLLHTAKEKRTFRLGFIVLAPATSQWQIDLKHSAGENNSGLNIKTIAWPVDISTPAGKKTKLKLILDPVLLSTSH